MLVRLQSVSKLALSYLQSVKIWGDSGRKVEKYIEKLKDILVEILPNPVGNVPSPRKVFKDQAEKLASENANIKQLIDAALSPQSKDAASMDANVFKAMQQLACDAVSSQEKK